MALKQGNRGSGNRKSSYGKPKDAPASRDMAQHLMEESEAFRKKVETATEEAWDKATSFLLEVVKGDYRRTVKVWSKKEDRLVEYEEMPTADTMIKAAKVLKEYTLDKTLADKKDKDRQSAGEKSAADLVKALQEIEERRRKDAEDKAIEAGKLTKIPEKGVKG